MAAEEEKTSNTGTIILLELATMLLTGFVASFYYLTRTHLGHRFIGVGFTGLAVQWYWAESYPAPEMYIFMCIWLAAGVFQKVFSNEFERSGGELHGNDTGNPYLLSWMPLIGRSERITCCMLEPGLVFLVGYALTDWLPGLAAFCSWGSLAMLVRANMQNWSEQRQFTRIDDDVVRARRLARHYHSRR